MFRRCSAGLKREQEAGEEAESWLVVFKKTFAMDAVVGEGKGGRQEVTSVARVQNNHVAIGMELEMML